MPVTAFAPRIPAWLPRLLAVAIIAGSVASVGWQAWQLRQDFRLPTIGKLQAPAAPAAPGSLANLFTPRQASAPPGSTSIEGLQLQASLVADVPSQSRALVLVPGSGTLNLQVGDALHDGMVLESVSAGQISLRQGSLLHVLELGAPALGEDTAESLLH